MSSHSEDPNFQNALAMLMAGIILGVKNGAVCADCWYGGIIVNVFKQMLVDESNSEDDLNLLIHHMNQMVENRKEIQQTELLVQSDGGMMN